MVRSKRLCVTLSLCMSVHLPLLHFCISQRDITLTYYDRQRRANHSTIAQYLSQPSLRSALGVSPSSPGNWSSCSNRVGALFALSNDELHASKDYVAALLEHGVRALIYVGSYDWICNWVGNERWVRALEWSGGDEWRKEGLGEWSVEGSVAGKVRSSGGLTFATIEGAGHMVRTSCFEPLRKHLPCIKRMEYTDAIELNDRSRWISPRKLSILSISGWLGRSSRVLKFLLLLLRYPTERDYAIERS